MHVKATSRPGTTLALLITVLLSATALLAQTTQPQTQPAYTATSRYQVRDVAGWRVLVHPDLLADAPLAKAALAELDAQLHQVIRNVPPDAVARLKKVAIWIELADPKYPGACYHPSPQWLAAHGFNPDKARSIEIGNARNFTTWTRAQPWMVLHEFAHAWHHQVLGYDHPGIRAAFKTAVESKSYESVLNYQGRKVRHYALNNDQEYFAEATEAYFGTNDFYPFVRAELKQHDPMMHDLLAEVWGVKPRRSTTQPATQPTTQPVR
jgi:hypothetical protein